MFENKSIETIDQLIIQLTKFAAAYRKKVITFAEE